MHKCQRCQSPATLHITEILGPGNFEEVHLCEQCAGKYSQEGPAKSGSAKGAKELTAEADEGLFSQHACPHCGIKFVDFRNSGRLGCPHDYDAFKEDLLPLLESVHGDTRHVGKVPRRLPRAKGAQLELAQLRRKLQQAVTEEAYEEAARIRDRIRELEDG